MQVDEVCKVRNSAVGRAGMGYSLAIFKCNSLSFYYARVALIDASFVPDKKLVTVELDTLKKLKQAQREVLQRKVTEACASVEEALPPAAASPPLFGSVTEEYNNDVMGPSTKKMKTSAPDFSDLLGKQILVVDSRQIKPLRLTRSEAPHPITMTAVEPHSYVFDVTADMPEHMLHRLRLQNKFKFVYCNAVRPPLLLNPGPNGRDCRRDKEIIGWIEKRLVEANLIPIPFSGSIDFYIILACSVA